ncbi:MAG: hypothetical protein FWG35_04830 [Spirochaetaceae bacterium]|nr:hypothetical protein [Spirochaetaceae bacterium]
MSLVKYLALLSVFVLFLAAPLSGQTVAARVVYAFLGIKAPNFIEGDKQTVERRMITEFVRLGTEGNFTLVTPRNREALLQNIRVGATAPKTAAPFAPGDLPSARGMIVGQLDRSEEIYRLQLEILRTENLAVTSAVQKNFPGLEPLLEDIPPMLRALFEIPGPVELHAPLPPALAAATDTPLRGGALPPAARLPTLKDLVGSWKGEGGIDSIRIDANGSALGHLGEWNLILLAVNIENDRIIIRQDEPNSPKLYMNTYPYSIAAKISEIARPLQWTFSLSADGNTLTGIEESTSFHIEQNEIVSWDDTQARNATWTRTSR